MTTSTTPTPSENGLLVAAFLAALFVVIMLCGCGGIATPASKVIVEDADQLSYIQPRDLSVVRIDGCQYLQWWYGRSAGLAHKGNCDNLIHCPCDTLR